MNPDTSGGDRPVKSCMDCPSFISSPAEGHTRFSRSLSGICGRFGTLITALHQTEAEQQASARYIGTNCDSHGEPMPAKPETAITVVTVPLFESAEDATGLACASCNGCSNFVPANEVHDQLSIPVPLCKAKGTLIYNSMREAKGCPAAAPGIPTGMAGLELVEWLKPGFKGPKVPKGKVNLVNFHADDPTTYKTDYPVTDEERAEGVRAWRKVEDPYGKKPAIPIPIFDSSENGIFTEAERATIPSYGDEHHPELYVDYGNLLWRFAVSGYTLDQTLFIQSLPGLGKTEFCYHLAYIMQVPFTRIFFTKSIQWDDIFGKATYKPDKGTYWQDGRYTAAYRRPGVTAVDEPNMAESEIVSTFRTTTELSKCLYLDAGYADDEQERLQLKVTPHKFHFDIWTGNPAWDPRNIGTNELAAADVSRLSPVRLEPPPEDIERAIIFNTVKELDGVELDDDTLDKLLVVSDDLRQASADLSFPGTWGVRENIKVARNLAWYPFVEAYRMAVLNHFHPDAANMIIEQSIKTVDPSDIGGDYSDKHASSSDPFRGAC